MKRKYIPLTILLLSALIAGCQQGIPDQMTLSGTIEADAIHAGSRIGGRVAAVMVDDGVMVAEGDVLFALETDVLEAERERLVAMMNEAEAAYNVVAAGARQQDIDRARQEAEALRQAWQLVEAGPLPEEIAALEAQAASLEAAYRNALDAADRMETLYAEGVIAEREFIAARETADAALNQWNAAVQQLEAARSRPRQEEIAAARARYYAAVNAVRSLEAGATQEQLDAARARIAAAAVSLDRIDVDLEEATVIAPTAGMISEFDIKPGDFIAPGQPTCEIIDMNHLKLVVYIPENRLGFIHEGDELAVRVDSFPGETFTGVVEKVSAKAEFTPRNVQVVEERVSQVFAVELSLDNSNLRLRPGMAADVTVSLVD